MNLQELVRLSLEEDIGPGDLSTEGAVPADLAGSARIIAKQALVVAGQAAAAEVFRQTGASCEPLASDGDFVEKGALLARIHGPLRAILSGERTALNFLMRLSGIATHTRDFARAAGDAFTVVDTRKTTPLHRSLEKAAVRAGGGRNHRFALYDGILLKENHLAVAGGPREAVRRVRERVHHLLRIQVEAQTLAEALEAVDAGADAILLDNMDDDRLAAAIVALRGKALVEASGNMDLARIGTLRAKGIHPDLVSVGGLVHHAVWADLSLLVDGA